MAVVDTYANALTEAGKLAPSLSGGVGAKTVKLTTVVSIASGDDDGSIYRLFKSVPSNYVPVSFGLYHSGVTGGTDYDIGLYEVGGAAVDADKLADGISMASARSRTTPNNVGLTTLGNDDYLLSLAELSAQENPDMSYDIAFTANTVGTAAGSILVIAEFAIA